MIETSTVNVGGWVDWGFFFSTLFGLIRLIYAVLPAIIALSVIGFALYLFHATFLQRFPK